MLRSVTVAPQLTFIRQHLHDPLISAFGRRLETKLKADDSSLSSSVSRKLSASEGAASRDLAEPDSEQLRCRGCDDCLGQFTCLKIASFCFDAECWASAAGHRAGPTCDVSILHQCFYSVSEWSQRDS